MARSASAPALNWLPHLYESGPAITRLADDEADTLAEIARLQAQIDRCKRDLAATRAEAESRAAALWSKAEIDAAKARARAEEAA